MRAARTLLTARIACVALGVALSWDGFVRAQPVGKVVVKVAVVSKDLTVKPVPKFALLLRERERPDRAPIRVVTGFDGSADVSISPGNYVLSSEKPLEFEGKSLEWAVELTVAGGAEKLLELSNDNATIREFAERPQRRVAEEEEEFQKVRDGVVTVEGELGRGSGFIVDPKGIVLTNHHVIARSEEICVQFDRRRKVKAVVLAQDPEKDIAALLVDLSSYPEAVSLPIAKASSGQATVVEGEKVFAVGSPLHQRKIITTGIVSKVESRVILSDVNINPGNSGGPLFNSVGEVIGITTFHDPGRGSPGISGIVKIEEAQSVLAEARERAQKGVTLQKDLLPVEPESIFPIGAIKEAVSVDRFDPKPYFESEGGYNLAFLTPPLKYYYRMRAEVEAARAKEKKKKRAEAIRGTFNPLEDLYAWQEYVGEYLPVVQIRAEPQFKETTGSVWLRVLVSPTIAPTLRFKKDFYKMALTCKGKEVVPIARGKVPLVVDMKTDYVNAVDAAFAGIYTYPMEAFDPSCGAIQLSVLSEDNPGKPLVYGFKEKTLRRIWEDFEPYRKTRESPVSKKVED